MQYDRDPEYQFVSTDVNRIVAGLLESFRIITGQAALPGSRESLFVHWAANVIVQERALTNYAGNQNLPSRAEGEGLDALGQLFYGLGRPEAAPASSMQRFHISAPQGTAILVPAGTKVTDAGNTLVWETKTDVFVPIGGTHADVAVICQSPGTVGNGYAPGQINTLIDAGSIAHYDRTENLTASGGGADRADDGGYYRLMRESQGAKSTAGAISTYIYYAMGASTEIADAVPVTPGPGRVNIYVLMKGGAIAGEETKNKVYDACSADNVRPLTDYVTVEDPEIVGYDIDLAYYIPSAAKEGSAQIVDAVGEAVDEYIAWQCGKLGRDINPDELRRRVLDAGAKRIVMASPQFAALRDGRSRDPDVPKVPQVAAIGAVNIVNGGYEDE
jgi:phage-related baseplate assembly protein